MSKPTPVPESVVGRLLATVSWEHATWYHAGGQGRENVPTAEVFQALDWLPRTTFLGGAVGRAQGAVETVRQLVREVEDIDFTLLPDPLYLADGSSGGRRRLWVEPDGLIDSPSILCLVGAKRIKAGSFQAEQLAREYLAVLKRAEVVGKEALLLLVLPDEPPVRVSMRGGRDCNPPRPRALEASREIVGGSPGE